MSERAIFWRVFPMRGGERVINMDHVAQVLFETPLEEMGEEPWGTYIKIKMVSGEQVELEDSRQKRIMVEDILNKASKPGKYFDDAPKETAATVHRRRKQEAEDLVDEHKELNTRVKPANTSYLVEEFSGTPSDLANRLSRYGGEGWQMVTIEDKYLVEDWEEAGLSESKYLWRLVMSKTLVRER